MCTSSYDTVTEDAFAGLRGVEGLFSDVFVVAWMSLQIPSKALMVERLVVEVALESILCKVVIAVLEGGVNHNC